MFESLLSLGLVVLFGIVGWAIGATTEALIRSGVGLVALGFAYGIPAAIVYHWLLYRSLSRCNRLPSRWWLQPTALHDLVPSDDRRGVLVWGTIGGTGFVMIVIGIVLASIGLWRIA